MNSNAADLECPFSEEEVFLAISSLGANKSPGLDGFTAEFLEFFWTTLKDDIMNMVSDFFDSRIINASLNETYICLIPKKLDARMIFGYWPISLIPRAYKIIAWVVSNRLKQVLPSTIALNQLAFVENRPILDASLMANELVDDWFHETKKDLIIKLDCEKAFEIVD